MRAQARSWGSRSRIHRRPHPESSGPGRARLSLAERGAVQVAAVAVAGFCIYGFAPLAGGLINAGQDVLYNASIGPCSKTLGTHVLHSMTTSRTRM